MPGRACFVGQETVVELRVVTVGIEQRVRAVGLRDLGSGDGVLQPAVVGLAGEIKHPTRHRDGDTVSGKFLDDFPGRCA